MVGGSLTMSIYSRRSLSLSFDIFSLSTGRSRSVHGKCRRHLPTSHFISSAHPPVFATSSSLMHRRPAIVLSPRSWSPVLQFISCGNTEIYSGGTGPTIASEQKDEAKNAELHIHNRTSRQKQKFQHKDVGKVSMNVCAVTDYDNTGHAEVYVASDVLFRYFRRPGREVMYIHNFSDVDDKGLEKLPFTSKPVPLGLPPESKFRVVDPEPKGFRGYILRLLGYYSKQGKLIRGARTLYSRVTTQVENPGLYSTFSLKQSFRTTHSMLVLHMWMCLVRLRAEDDGAVLGQFLYEIFNNDLEQRVASAGVKMLSSKWMKDLEKNFYGAVIAYDAAMRPEALEDDLLGALWRNVFAEDQSLMPTGSLAIPIQTLARYVRRETACLSLTESDALLSGNILFTSTFEVSRY